MALQMVYSVACFKIQDEKPPERLHPNWREHGLVAKVTIINKTGGFIPQILSP